jgi:hypothetical protein
VVCSPKIDCVFVFIKDGDETMTDASSASSFSQETASAAGVAAADEQQGAEMLLHLSQAQGAATSLNHSEGIYF